MQSLLCGSFVGAAGLLRRSCRKTTRRDVCVIFLGHFIQNGLKAVHCFHPLVVCVASCFDSTPQRPRTEVHAHTQCYRTTAVNEGAAVL